MESATSKPIIVNVADVPEEGVLDGEHWGGYYKPLTPAFDALGGRLGANLNRLPQGRTGCPFHAHAREDELFFVLSGRGFLRYGETLQPLKAGDCVSCPAGTGIAHQLFNPYPEDLVYLAVGPNDPHEVCTYPDSGKVWVRSLKRVSYMEPVPYMAGEPSTPRIAELVAQKLAGEGAPAET